MDPLQRLAQKKHPLQLPNKTEKVEPKVPKEVKQPEKIKIENVPNPTATSQADPVTHPATKIQQKPVVKSQPVEHKQKKDIFALLGVKKEQPKQIIEVKVQKSQVEHPSIKPSPPAAESKVIPTNINTNKIELKQQAVDVKQKKITEKGEVKNPLMMSSKVKHEPKPEIVQVISQQAKKEIKQEIQQQIKKEVKPQLKSQMRFEPKVQIKPVIKVQTKPEIQSQIKQQVKPEIKTEVKSQIKPQLAAQTHSEVKQQPKKEKSSQIKVITQSIGEKQQKEIEKHPVKIEINDSSQKGSGLIKHTYFQITGEDNHGPFVISRKYQEFQALSVILHERWPGCFIPSISKHCEIKNPDEKQKHKRVTLANFLIGLSYSSHLYYREEVQLFLRSPDVDVIQMFEKMPPLKSRDVIERFKQSFGEELEVPSSQTYTTFNSNFVLSLRKIINNLGTLSLKALALSEAYDNYSQCMAKFGKIQKNYEQLCLSQYTDTKQEKSILTKDNENRIDRLQDLSRHNPFYKLYSFLSNEVKDAEAFLQVIIASELFVLRKEDLEKQIKDLQSEIETIMLGHKTIKTMASRKSKEEVQSELELKHKKLTEGKNTMIEMFRILEILLATKSIALFKSFKRNNYKTILYQWVIFSSQTTPQLEVLWQFIAEDSKGHFRP